MSCVVSFVNTKGGVGKSFLSVHMAVWLADAGFRVALLDADDQRTASKWLSGVSDHAVAVTVLEGTSEEFRSDNLRMFINEQRASCDFVVIDTKGNAGLSTSAAVIKSDVAVIPLQPSAADLWPIETALSTVRLSQEARGGHPKAFLVLNQTDDADVLARDVRALAVQFRVPMAQTNIKRLRAYRNAPGLRMVATRLTDKRGKAAADRLAGLFTELLDGFMPVIRVVGNG